MRISVSRFFIKGIYDKPNAFKDYKQANDLDGKNGRTDGLDKAKWADYTFPEMGDSYRWSENILKVLFEKDLNGSIILIHVGTDPRRKDKLYNRLPENDREAEGKGL